MNVVLALSSDGQRAGFTSVILSLLAILLVTPTFGQAEESPSPYAIIDPPIRSYNEEHIEIIEWFWYASPESYQSFSTLTDWEKQLPNDVEIRRMPAVLKDDWAILADVYLAIEKIGLAESLHERVYQAVIREGLNWLDERYLFDWIDRQGADVAAFARAFRSEEVYRNRLYSEQLARSIQIKEVPAFLVQGRYLITSDLAGGIEHFPDALNRVIAEIRQNKR